MVMEIRETLRKNKADSLYTIRHSWFIPIALHGVFTWQGTNGYFASGPIALCGPEPHRAVKFYH